MIKIEGFSKKYGDFVAVDNLSLEIEKGAIFGFLGPNGAGKTTTLRSLMGLLKPSQGKILIDGLDTQESIIKIKSIVGYLPDEVFLYEYLTARQLLDFVAKIHNLPHEGKKERINQLIATFGLESFADELIANYSFGMRKKTALASIVIHEPKLLILDEPFNGLDPQATKDFNELLKGMVQAGTTIIFSSHVLEVVEKLVTHIGIINEGKLMLNASLEETQSHHQSLEQAFFKLTKKD
jgi:ABC-2 type transport system ATP-binding protein